MLQINGARVSAIVTTGIVAGWFIAADNAAKVVRYRTLTPDALLNEVVNKNSGGLPGSIIGAVVLIAVAVILVDLLTRLFEAVWGRLQPAK
jgi:hypothetical protein